MYLLVLLALSLLQGHRVPAGDEVARLRAEGPAALDRLLARYDTLPAGAEKDELERAIDAVAAQRYATFSRLYWYTDLEAAKGAARASGRPILSLRMLGRLDEDLSCANSRLFRVVLYANEDVSTFLRDHFIPHWSSERPAPKVTVDFGDGRKIETTVGGNSAHFVLDADGRPIDVLPGVYSPVAFRRELAAALPLALESPGLPETERTKRLREYHRERAEAAGALWSNPGPDSTFPVPAENGVFAAEGLTRCKGMIETPLVLRGGLDPQRTPRRLSLGLRFTPRLEEARLDARSRELVRRLRPTDWANPPKPLDAKGLDAEIAVLEANVAADTAENEGFRSAVHNWFQSPAAADFVELSRRLYTVIFLTPADDPWLGLSTPLIFTGLPGDGVLR